MTLAFGLIKNHPFHNGNKRTALVSLLVHLDKNKLVFKETVDHRDVYEFIKRVAEQPNARDFSGQVGLSDSQLQGHIGWLKSRVRSVYRGEHPVTVRQLKRILAAYGFDLCDPNHNFADIFKTEEVVGRSWLGFAKRRAVRKKVFQIACSGPNQTVQVSTIKEIRKRCKLQELDGVDSDQFYSGAERTDFYLNSYRKILNRLAYE